MSNVLLVYPALIPSTLLCGKLQLEWLDRQGHIHFQAVQRERVTAHLSRWADVVILVRADSLMERDLLKKWKKAGKYSVYVLDDDLLNVPENMQSSDHYRRSETVRTMREIMALCDCLLSPSKTLLRKYKRNFEKCALVEEPASVPNSTVPSFSSPIKIGFAGSVDRTEDIDRILQGVLRRLIHDYGGRIGVEMFGPKPKIVEELGIRYIPYCNSYETYLKTIQSLAWEIGLAPLSDTEFAACKHYNKYIEYAACGIAGIYSEVEPYTRVVEHGKNGLLCQNTEDEWYHALTRLIEDRTLRNQISQNVFTDAQTRFSIEATALKLQESLSEILWFESDRRVIHGIPWLRFQDFARRTARALMKYGWRFPAVALRKFRDVY